MAVTPDPQASARFPWHQGANGATIVTRAEAARRARELLEGADYKASITRRIKTDSLPAAVETMLWHYAYGKPLESVDVTVRGEVLKDLSIDELQDRLRAVNDQLEEARLLEDAIPAEFKVA